MLQSVSVPYLADQLVRCRPALLSFASAASPLGRSPPPPRCCRRPRSYSLLQTMATPESALKPAQAFVEFVNASPTPFHAVQESVLRLEKAGFMRLSRTAALCRRL